MTSTAIQAFAFQYSLYSNFIISIAGIISNVINLLVFVKLKPFRENRCGFYLIVESVSDLVDVTFILIITIVSLVYGDESLNYSLFWCRIRYITFQTGTLTTFSMICFAAIDQYCSTNYRLSLRQFCNLNLARYLVLTSVCLWFVHSLIFGLFADVNPTVGCYISNSEWIRYGTYFFYPILYGFLPIALASLFSLLAYRNVRRIIRRQTPIERRRFDRQITAMVLIRVGWFVAVSIPYTSYRVYSINISTKQVDALRSAIERLIQVIFYSIINTNYALNFYIFLISSSRYRRQVKYIFKKKYWRPIKYVCCSNDNQVRPENIMTSDANIDLD
ncbi:unnamed protein product [Adineta ricciae]|uniref:G-protein coupled receptors family 1 profile domain-containing protein n=1 Tax=Adineta ricciae TaxID=249248 RepID=A0A815Z717_ADIRI|nr:unnamed protein product [Adineta ricciae]CAF1578988.1 unnamed protein product [Adineta ricciae]